MVTVPEGWKECPIGNIFNVSSGGDIKKQWFSKQQTPKYPYEIFSNGIENRGLYGYTSKAIYAGNAVTVTARGTIGKAFYRKEPFDAIVRLLVLSPKSEDVNPKFYEYYINSKIIFEKEVTGVPQLTAPKIKNKFVPILDKKEQTAIVNALSSFDTYIDNLTELIEKKKNIRDGALEDLVSGKTRLDGFSSDWVKMPLSSFTSINPKSDIPEEFIYVDLESVKGISLIGFRKEKKISAPSRAQRLAKKGDVFFQTVRPYQRNNYFFNLDGDFVFSTGYAQLRTKNSPNYLFILIRQDSFVNSVLDNCTGTSYPAINPTKLGQIEIYVPIDKKEQEAIASVLTTMDEEISNLEAEKAKMVQIREGAMDDLLTGRVRLKL